MTIADPRQPALFRILKATGKLTARTTYLTASAGALVLLATNTSPDALPPAIAVYRLLISSGAIPGAHPV